MYVCSNNISIVYVCMYVVMYMHIIPILSTTVLSDIHYYNTYTILFVYTVLCAKTVELSKFYSLSHILAILIGMATRYI